ncbi:hypothetical protein AC579_923 [Pseudocercospora musae]|uniref:Uncharacterized protein n=1 Tax=Pseudocercospora musae TaxID=113226 RepID=A0A139I0V3_9PEZI|nr:hypothetical protein AC579_923 [Pseudocercospora musae]
MANASTELLGSMPEIKQTNSEHINLSLIGAVPSLANAIVATEIFEARGGESQKITVDLQRSHNYIDPDIGMTPKINGQSEINLDLVGGNPFLGNINIYETADGRHVGPSAVYVDLVYQWSTFLRCAVNTADIAAAIANWKVEGE